MMFCVIIQKTEIVDIMTSSKQVKMVTHIMKHPVQ